MDDQLQVVAPLLAALGLSSLIGIEREFRFKSAGLRTHTLVGVGAALFVIVGKHGFPNPGGAPLDSSRVAAQVVTGIGFIGAGLIVLQRDRVRGLTSAAVIWLTAAVGMACGADMWFAGSVTVASYYFVMFVYPFLLRRVPKSKWAPSTLRVTYRQGEGTLREVLRIATSRGYTIGNVDVSHGALGLVEVGLVVTGSGSLPQLVSEIDGLDGVTGVHAGDEDDNEL